MTMSLTSPVTGSAQTGFTSPTYTLTTDIAPSPNGKQYAVTGLGGTQASVDSHSASKPFTISVFKPQQIKTLPAANPITGIIKSVPVNTYKVITRKGAAPAVNQVPQIARITSVIDVPAGTDTYEPEELRAMLSAHIGALTQMSAELGNTLVTGII